MDPDRKRKIRLVVALSAAVLLLRWWMLARKPAPDHVSDKPIAGVCEGEVRDR